MFFLFSGYLFLSSVPLNKSISSGSVSYKAYDTPGILSKVISALDNGLSLQESQSYLGSWPRELSTPMSAPLLWCGVSVLGNNGPGRDHISQPLLHLGVTI